MNKLQILFLFSLPIYLVGAWNISEYVYKQVISGIHQYEIWKWRKTCQKLEDTKNLQNQ